MFAKDLPDITNHVADINVLPSCSTNFLFCENDELFSKIVHGWRYRIHGDDETARVLMLISAMLGDCVQLDDDDY